MFQEGMKVVYYPAKANEQDNRHPVATVRGETRTGRVRIEWQDTTGAHKATVAPYRLEARQPDLLDNC